MSELSVNFCNISFSNPFILPSGVYSSAGAYKKAFKSGAGTITWKSLTKTKREGNPLPRVWKYDCGTINSVGLTNPGIKKGTEEIKLFINENPDIHVIASVFSTKIKEFVSLIEEVKEAKPSLIELNLSCPNVDMEFGKPLGMEKGAAGKIVKEVKRVSGNTPIIAKLSPNVFSISDIAKSCEEAGADAICAINTVGPGMLIDIDKKKPILGAKRGGVSGPGIFPIALRCVYDIYEVVKIPIIGMGGISKWQDVAQMMMAGAALIGIGTSTYTNGMKLYNNLFQNLTNYLKKEGINNIQEIIGLAHRT